MAFDGLVWAMIFIGPINYPPSHVVILACNDDHRKMEGFLFKRDPWDSILVAFNA